MISFSSFLQEAVATNKRQGLTHLTQMKPHIFIDWLDSLKKDAAGFIDNKVQAVLKCDGLGFRFGKSDSGKVFIEGSRTGPQFDSGAFSAYATAKGSIEEVIIRSRHYDDMLTLFQKDNTFMKAVPNDTKIYCEIFYTPLAQLEDETGIQFVTIKYDKKKVGSLMTILPYSALVASTGQPHPDSDSIVAELVKKSSPKIRIVDPRLKIEKSIDLNGFINPLKTLLDDKEETKRILQSRKKIDKEKKQNLLGIIRKVQEDISAHLLFNPNICGQDKLCAAESGEGLVFKLGKDFGDVKVISPRFQMDHHGTVK